MTSPSQKAFIITLALYSTLILAGYWLYTSEVLPVKEHKVKLTTVPVTLAMFQAPAVVTPTPPAPTKVNIKAPKKVEPKIKPKVKPDTTPKAEPRPVQTHTPKTIKPQIIKPTEPKKILPPKEKLKEQPIKPEQTQPSTPSEPVKKSLPPPPKVQAPTTIQTKQPPSPPAQLSLPNTEQAEQTYLNELNTQIAQYAKNTYPKRAKRRRWEGEVLIQFTLYPNGAIKNIRIIQSSGRTLLDEAAIQIFKTKMNSQFKPFPSEIVRNKWILKVPVDYGLED